MNEEWRDVKGFEGIYQVSNLGNVRSLSRLDARGHSIKGKMLSTNVPIKAGYPCVNLKNGKHKRLAVPIHRLVAENFIPNNDDLPQVNHIDGNKMNNSVDNLEWVSCSDNIRHAVMNNLMPNHYYAYNGETNPRCKLTDNQISEIRNLYSQGIKSPMLSKMFGVSKSHICAIVKHKIRNKGSEKYECVCR